MPGLGDQPTGVEMGHGQLQVVAFLNAERFLIQIPVGLKDAAESGTSVQVRPESPVFGGLCQVLGNLPRLKIVA